MLVLIIIFINVQHFATKTRESRKMSNSSVKKRILGTKDMLAHKCSNKKVHNKNSSLPSRRYAEIHATRQFFEASGPQGHFFKISF